MTTSEQIALVTTYFCGQVFIFCDLINKNVLEWFLLIMCRERTLSGSTNLLSKNHRILCLRLRKRIRQIPNIIIFMISNFRKSYNEFLESFLLNVRKCLYRMFLHSHFWTHILEKTSSYQLKKFYRTSSFE